MFILGLYEELCINNEKIKIEETDQLPNFQPGCYMNGKIYIRRNLSEVRKAEVLYEELAHHKLTYGNILDQTKWINRKFENYARRHGFTSAVPLHEIVEAIEQYKKIYGIGTHYGEYSITFEPLRVFKYKEI